MNKKAYLAFAVSFGVFCSVAASAASLEFDGVEIGKDSQPVISKGLQLVPMRALLEKKGMEVTWDASTKTAIAKNAAKSFEVTIGSKDGKVDGQNVSMDTAPIIQKGRTMIPLSLAEKILGMKLFFNKEKGTVTTYSDAYLAKMDDLKLTFMLARSVSSVVSTEQGDLKFAVSIITHRKMDPALKYDFYITNTIDATKAQGVPAEKKQAFMDSLKTYITQQADFAISMSGGKSKLEGAIVLKGADNKSNKILSWANYDYATDTIDGKGFRWTTQFDDKID